MEIRKDPEHEIFKDLEAAGFVLGIVLLFRRIRSHHHGIAAVVMLVFSAAAFIILINLNMESDAAYLFWALAFIAFIAFAKCLS